MGSGGPGTLTVRNLLHSGDSGTLKMAYDTGNGSLVIYKTTDLLRISFCEMVEVVRVISNSPADLSNTT